MPSSVRAQVFGGVTLCPFACVTCRAAVDAGAREVPTKAAERSLDRGPHGAPARLVQEVHQLRLRDPGARPAGDGVSAQESEHRMEHAGVEPVAHLYLNLVCSSAIENSPVY